MKTYKIPALLISPMRRDANVDAVVAKMQQRSEVGLLKYGTTTERSDVDLEGWLTHLQEELMDAAIYVQAIKQNLLKDQTNETVRIEDQARKSAQVFENLVQQL